MIAPRPADQASFIGAKAPPLRSITGLVRRKTVRAPASVAARVAPSHWTVTWARKSAAARSSSVNGSALATIPYRAIPLPWISTGRWPSGRAAIASATVWVVRTLEERMPSRRCSVHGALKTPTPPKLTTASTPSSAAGSISPRSGSQPNSVDVAGLRRTSRVTS